MIILIAIFLIILLIGGIMIGWALGRGVEDVLIDEIG